MHISVDFEIPMGHRLPDHEGRCRFYHGHNYKVTFHLSGPLNLHTGMLVDFADVKAAAKAILDKFDHTMVVKCGDPFPHQFPTHRCIVLSHAPTAEVLACLWNQMLIAQFQIDGSYVEVRETTNTCVYSEAGRFVTIISEANV